MKKLLLAFVCILFLSATSYSQIRILQRRDGGSYIVAEDEKLKEILTYLFTIYYKKSIRILPSEVFEKSYYLILGFESLEKDLEFCIQPMTDIEYKIENDVIIFSERKKRNDTVK